jgi:hypothetical protein
MLVVLIQSVAILLGAPLQEAADLQPPPAKPVAEAVAQSTSQNPDPSVRLARYVRAMDDGLWRVREQATFDLARDRDVTEQRIVNRLRQPELSHEQRLRLLRSIETRLLQLPRGALGIRMKRDIVTFQNKAGEDVRGVEIQELLPGMPAEEHLKVGDIIVSIQGERIIESKDVSRLIKQHWPEEEISLEIARDEPADAAAARRSRILTVQVKLGSTDQLETTRTMRGGWNEQQQLEARVRKYYAQYGPIGRPLNQPAETSSPPVVSTLSMGYDPGIVLQQLMQDRAMIEEGNPNALTRAAFTKKWRRFATDIKLLIDTNAFDIESKRIFERLRARVLEMIELE